MRRRFSALVAGGIWMALAVSAAATPIAVGSGQNTSYVWLNFKDGAVYDFAVSYDGTKNGLDLFDIIQANSSLTTTRGVFGTGVFIDGISFHGHSNSGYAGGEDWWHQWVRGDGQGAWAMGSGAQTTIESNGSYEGWVYGSAAQPVPEPAGIALILGAGLILLTRPMRGVMLTRAPGALFRQSGSIARASMRSGTGMLAPAVTHFAKLRHSRAGVSMAPGALLLVGVLASAASAYTYNASDFATQVINYTQGTGVGTDFLSGQPYTDPTNALGRPTIDTTGDGWAIDPAEHVPVVPVYGPWRANEIVTVGQGGSLTLKFDRRVYNNPANPFGMDFIVFGNSTIYVDGTNSWDNRDPSAMRAGALFGPENGLVSVSQDGQTWHAFANGPFADSFAPTLGRVYDPAHPDSAVGAFNQWWGAPTDPTLPLNPSLSSADLAGKTIADMAQLYGQSAGGTGFDIGMLGLDWIQYVKIDNPQGSGVTPDIDAISIVSAVPEPGALALVMMGTMLLLRRTRRI